MHTDTRSTDKPISVLAVDDHPIFLQGIADVLAGAADLRLVAAASSGSEALALYRQHRPDITLMDLQMPDMGGMEALRRIRRDAPAARVIVLTTFESGAQATEAIRAGAAGYLLKSAVRTELLEAIRCVHGGLRRIDPDVACAMAEQLFVEQLSSREIEILRLVAEGNTNARIAGLLHLSEGTVKSHMQNVLGKLKARDRANAVLLGIERGLIGMGPRGRLPPGAGF